MRACTIATVLSFAAAGLAKPWGPADSGSGTVGLPSGAIVLCCAGDFAGSSGGTPGAGGTPACVAYNSAIQNCAAGQVKFTCPVTNGVLQGCSDPAGVAAAANIVSEVTNLASGLLVL